MNDWQTPVALLVVLAATAYLGRTWWKSRKEGTGCGKGCGCPAGNAKARLKK